MNGHYDSEPEVLLVSLNIYLLHILPVLVNGFESYGTSCCTENHFLSEYT